MKSWSLLLLVACGGPVVGPREGQRAPAIDRPDTSGALVELVAGDGRPEVVVFWASWCGTCRAEARRYVALHEAYGDRLGLVGVNAGEDAVTAGAAASALEMDWPTVLDQDGALQARFAVDAVPLVLVVDDDGIVRYRGTGLPDDAVRLLDGLLG